MKRRILLIDDNPSELDLIRQCFLEAADANGMVLDILTALDGRQALAVLNDCKLHSQLPELVLVDLNMPHAGGYDFLIAIKNHPRYSRLCVIVFTSADHPQEIKKAYQEKANGFVKKPFSFSVLKETVSQIVGFWLAVNIVDVLLD